MPPKVYKRVLQKVMSHIDGIDYDTDHEHSRERLGSLTPEDLLLWFNHKCFGSSTPDENALPVVRSSSIEFWKKALSAFMPNRLMSWNEISQVGNPTKSTQLNDLIKLVKKYEVRKQGVPSQARRPFSSSEFEKIKEMLKSHGKDIIWLYGVPAQMNYQFHMIARADDTMNVLLDSIQAHPRFNFCLKTKLNWSKNVREERDAPWQVIMGSSESTYCVIISLAIWLEIYFKELHYSADSPFLFAFSPDCRFPEGASSGKDKLRRIFSDRVFRESGLIGSMTEGGILGTHSNQKFASTHARASGISKDDRDLRGRWKGKGRVADKYDDVELPYVDAKVAASLCMGGPCKYVVTDEYIDNDFILNYVVPKMRSRVDEQVCVILGTALLYFCFTHQAVAEVPPSILSAVHTAYRSIDRRPGDAVPNNPVKKVLLILSGQEGEVYLDEAVEDAEAGRNDDSGGGLRPTSITDRPTRDQLRALHSQLVVVKSSISKLERMITEEKVTAQRYYQSMQANIKRIAMSPGRRIPTAVEPVVREQVTLSSNPRTLYDLWEEYNTGIGGRKAAKHFSPSERGKVKYKYTRRKVVWEVITKLTNSGLHANTAIDRIYEYYGREKTVTQIINIMRRDRTNNFVPPPFRLGGGHL